jgi:hypothetical protein
METTYGAKNGYHRALKSSVYIGKNLGFIDSVLRPKEFNTVGRVAQLV